MKHLITIGVLCVGLVGGIYLWQSPKGPVNPLDSVSPTAESPDTAAFTALDRASAWPTAGDAARNAAGAPRRLEIHPPVGTSESQGIPWKDIADSNRPPHAVAAPGPDQAPTIGGFLHRWADAYARTNAHFEELEETAPAILGSAEIESIGRLLGAGGAKAEAALVKKLQATEDPLELALLSEVLETQAPGLYREAILEAARETLENMAYREDPQGEPYMGPVFELLQKYGDERVVSDLQQVPPRWQPYATVALAKMPQGQGVPTLIDVVQGQGALRTLEGQRALEMLAQVSLDDALAYDTLVEKAQADEIPGHVWSNIAAVVAGDHQGQIEPPDGDAASGTSGSVMRPSPYSTQTFFYEDGVRQAIYLVNQSAVLSQGELEERLALIEDLKAKTANPRAIDALESARDALLSRDLR